MRKKTSHRLLGILFFTLLNLFLNFTNASAISLWVGESTTLTAPAVSVPPGYDNVITNGYNWSIPESSKGYLSMGTGVGLGWNTVTVSQFFTGSKQIACTIYYQGVRIRLGKQDFSDMRSTTVYFNIECNKVNISLYPTSMELNIGESGKLQYQFSPATSQPAATVAFSSSNPEVADVDFNGTVHAIGTGTATITAKTNFETTATCQVTVNAVKASSIALNQKALDLQVGQTTTLTATIQPENTTDKSLHWETSDENIATVDQTGKVTAVSYGNTRISATTLDGSDLTAWCDVSVSAPAESLTLSSHEKTIGIGEAFLLRALIEPEGASPGIAWQSSNPSVAYVDQNGRVEGFETGTATITAKTTDGSLLSDACTVTVIKHVSTIMLNTDALTLNVGDKESLTATINPTDATIQTLAWASDNPSVANVQEGVVTALGNGNAIITATSTDGANIQASCRITVETPVSAILLDRQELFLNVGDFTKLSATILPESASHREVTWQSSAPSVAEVQGGIILAHKEGTATVTAFATDRSGISATCDITVSNTVGINEPETDNHLIVKGKTITIEGIPRGTNCRIYRSDGTCVYNHPAGSDSCPAYTAETAGIYIVCIGEKVHKVLLGN